MANSKNITFDQLQAALSRVKSALDGKANTSHGNHVPKTETANNARFLRNDNTWQTITPVNIGAADRSHSHGSYVNQNAFSNIKVGDTTVAADSPTDTLTLTAGANVTITPDATNDSVTIAAKDTVYTHPTTSGYKHIPSGGSSGQILRWSADGTAAWGSDNNTDTKVTNTLNTTAKAYVTGTTSATTNTGTQVFDTGVYLDTTAGKLVATTFAGTLSGNASSATQLQTGRKFTIGNTERTFNGSGDVKWTLADIGAAASSHTHNYVPLSNNSNTIIKADADASSAEEYAQLQAGHNYLRVTSSAGGSTTTQGADKLTFNGNVVYHAGKKPTPAEIGAAAASHGTHVTWSTTTPKANGTAAVGTETKVARGDHVHPLQTTVSGNAGTATKLQTARTLTIGNKGKTFDGSANVSWSLSEIGAAASGHTHNKITSRGKVAAETGTTRPAVDGLSMAEVYNNEYPTAYGNAITLKGQGDGQILVGWSGSSGGHAPVYVRSKRDNADASWSGWAQFYTSANPQTSVSGNAGTATKLQNARNIKIGNTTRSFNGTADVTWTLGDIGAAAASHGTHVTYATANPLVAGTAAVGTSSKVAREDHVHPLQTSVSGSSGSCTGNAATATKLQTARNIALTGTITGNANFDGSGNISIATSVGSTPASGSYFKGVPIVTSAGVMEVGKYIDFHNASNSTADYDVRLQCNGTSANTVNMPTSNGTLALLGDNVASATKLQTARKLTIGNTGKTFNGTADVTWSLAEIGAAASSHGHSNMLTFKANHTSDWTSATSMADKVYMGGWHGTITDSSKNKGYVSLGLATSGKALDFMLDGDFYANENNLVLNTGNYKSHVTPANIGAAASNHNHGLLHNNLTVTVENTTTDSGWSMINSSYDGFILKSIRSNRSAPSWLQGNYSAGIAFGGGDTKGVVSVAYGSPAIKFAGGNGTKPVWNMSLTGTSGNTYNMDSLAANTAKTLATARTINGTSFNGSANITTANWGTARTLTIGNSGKSVNGSGNVSWSLSEIGAAPIGNASQMWSASVKCATWSRLFYFSGNGTTGGSFMFNIQGTRGNVVHNVTLLVNFSHSNQCNIVQLHNTSYSNMQVRCVTKDHQGYVEVYDNANNATNSTAQALNVTFTPLSNVSITKYTAFTDGSTVPSGYATKALTTVSGSHYSGNAATTTKLQTARTLTVGKTGKNFDGSGNVSWSTSEILHQGKITNQDWNTANVEGVYEIESFSGSNSPTGAYKWGGLLTLRGGNVTNQVYLSHSNNEMWIRGGWNGTFNSSWSRVYTTSYKPSLSDIGAAASSHTHNYAGSSSAGGNANAAVKLATARTINGTNFDGSANITTANWGTARTLTIGNKGQSVNGSGNVSWSLADIGAATTNHDYQAYNNLTDKTTNLNNLNQSGGNKKIYYYQCFSDSGGANITGRPDDNSKQAFSLVSESIRYAGNTDYITKQTYTQGASKRTWERFITNGTASAWRARAYTDDNVASATKLQNARTINGTSFNGTGNITTANWGTARTLTIGSTGKSVNGSGNVSWTLDEIGAPSKTGAGASGTWGISVSGNSNTTNYLNSNTRMDYGWNGVNYFNIDAKAGNGAKVNDGPTKAWWHIMRFNHANSAGFYTDLAIPFNSTSLYYKRITSGAVQNGGWVKVLDSLNYNEYAAAKSHGNHVPATQTADNKKFLRNDNTWQTVTPANIGAVPTGTGGNITIHADNDASSANEYALIKAGHNELKVASSAGGTTVTKGQDKLTFNGNIVYHAGRKPTLAELGAAASNHSHSNYAASSHEHNYLNVKGDNTINSTANDTTAKWGAQGNSVHWYTTANQLNGQPSQWGYLINIGKSSEVHQIWMEQASGSLSHRGGNGSGWSGSWRTILDSSNYSTWAAAKSHSHNYAGSSSAGGNANAAVKLATARTLTIGNKGKNFDGSGNVSWSLSEIGAAAANHNHDSAYLKLSGGTLSGSLTVNNNVYSQGFCVSKNSKEVWLDIGDNDTYIWASGANKSLQITHSGDLNFDGQPVLYGGRGNNYDTATNTIYFNNAGASHKGRISCYKDGSNKDYVQTALRTASDTTNYVNIYEDTVKVGSNNIYLGGKKLTIATSAPSGPATGDVWINIG